MNAMNKFNATIRSAAKRRAASIVKKYVAGTSVAVLAKQRGVSRQRIYQILLSAGVRRGRRKNGWERRPDIDVSKRRYLRLSALGVVRAYDLHRSGALARKIPWGFTLSTWQKMWAASGKWKLRGKRGGKNGYYVMARFQDVGPYSPQNCRICTQSDNVKEALLRESMIQRGILEELFDKDGRAFQPDRKFRRLVSW